MLLYTFCGFVLRKMLKKGKNGSILAFLGITMRFGRNNHFSSFFTKQIHKMYKIPSNFYDMRKFLTKNFLVPLEMPGVLGVSISKSHKSMILTPKLQKLFQIGVLASNYSFNNKKTLIIFARRKSKLRCACVPGLGSAATYYVFMPF